MWELINLWPGPGSLEQPVNHVARSLLGMAARAGISLRYLFLSLRVEHNNPCSRNNSLSQCETYTAIQHAEIRDGAQGEHTLVGRAHPLESQSVVRWPGKTGT